MSNWWRIVENFRPSASASEAQPATALAGEPEVHTATSGPDEAQPSGELASYETNELNEESHLEAKQQVVPEMPVVVYLDVPCTCDEKPFPHFRHRDGSGPGSGHKLEATNPRQAHTRKEKTCRTKTLPAAKRC